MPRRHGILAVIVGCEFDCWRNRNRKRKKGVRCARVDEAEVEWRPASEEEDESVVEEEGDGTEGGEEEVVGKRKRLRRARKVWEGGI